MYLAFAQGILGGDEDIPVAVKQLKGSLNLESAPIIFMDSYEAAIVEQTGLWKLGIYP